MSQRLANGLRERRTELRLTQGQLAELCLVSLKTINTVENRVFIPSTLLALKLALALEASVEALFFLEE